MATMNASAGLMPETAINCAQPTAYVTTMKAMTAEASHRPRGGLTALRKAFKRTAYARRAHCPQDETPQKAARRPHEHPEAAAHAAEHRQSERT